MSSVSSSSGWSGWRRSPFSGLLRPHRRRLSTVVETQPLTAVKSTGVVAVLGPRTLIIDTNHGQQLMTTSAAISSNVQVRDNALASQYSKDFALRCVRGVRGLVVTRF